MIASLIALLFGLLIGSFLNVCIHRWPQVNQLKMSLMPLRREYAADDQYGIRADLLEHAIVTIGSVVPPVSHQGFW